MTITVSSGVSSGGLTISSGDPLIVLSGGFVESSTILSGGSATVSSGGLAAFLNVSSGGVLQGPGDVTGGINDSGLVSGVHDYANLGVSGSARGIQVEGAGQENIFSGGKASLDTILSGGLLGLYGGKVLDEVVESGGTVELGATLSTNFTAGPVTATESISGVTISSGGIVELNTATVEDGATLSLTSGGIAYDLTVARDSVVTGAGTLADTATVYGVISGVSIGDDNVFDLAEVSVLSGGSAVGVTVSGGFEGDSDLLELASGATATGVIVIASGGFYNDGVATGTTISNAYEVIDQGGSDSGVTVGGGGSLDVGSGSVGSVTVLDGGLMTVAFATASGVTLRAGGELDVAGGAVSAVTVESGATLKYLSGTLSRVAVRSGATFEFEGVISSNFTDGAITSTTTMNGATLSSGAVLDLFNATVLSGATLTLAPGGAATFITVSSGAVVNGTGDVTGVAVVAGAIDGVSVGGGTVPNEGLVILSGGTASGVTMLAGARLAENTMIVSAGGTATDLIIEAYNMLDVDGSVTGVQLESGSVEGVARGSASDETIDGGAIMAVYNGVTTSTTVLSGGGVIVEGGGRLIDDTADAGAAERVSASTTTGTILSGGSEVVSSGSIASGTLVLSGANQYLSSGGEAVNAVVSSGGVERVLASAKSIDAQVGAGGEAIVSSGGVATGLSAQSGAILIDNGEVRIEGAGSLAGTLSGSGAIIQTTSGDLVLSDAGAKFAGKAVISGGVIELASAGALGSGLVEFAVPTTGSAVLQIDAADAPAAGATFANTIANFSGAGEEIDLAGLAFSSGATATVSGSTLTLTDGGGSYSFLLSGDKAAGYQAISDGHGGTLIETTAAMSPAVASFAQAAAAFAPSRAAAMTPMSANTTSSLALAAHATSSAAHT